MMYVCLGDVAAESHAFLRPPGETYMYFPSADHCAKHAPAQIFR
jgi:hypothetical protein